MVCLGLEPGAAGWKAQTNPLSYGGTPKLSNVYLRFIYLSFQDVPIPSIGLTRLKLCPLFGGSDDSKELITSS